MKRLFAFFSVLAIAAGLAPRVQAETSGTAAYSFLNIPVGARATGMGEAFTSVPNDIQSLAYNPAGLATLVASQVSFQHLSYVEDTIQEALAFGHAGRQQGLSWGLSTNYLRVGNIPRTITNLADTTGDGFTQTGDFSTYDLAVGASVAGPVADGLVLGSTVKLIRESLGDASASAGAVDLGAIYQLIEQRSCNLGVSIQNAGYSSKFADAAVKLPLTGRIGISGQPFSQWLVSTDFLKPIDSEGQFNIGAEMTPEKMISLRAGYQYALKRADLGGLTNFSLGMGLRFDHMSIDYAFLPLGDLGSSHRISLNYRFKPKFDTSNSTPANLRPAADATSTSATSLVVPARMPNAIWPTSVSPSTSSVVEPSPPAEEFPSPVPVLPSTNSAPSAPQQ